MSDEGFKYPLVQLLIELTVSITVIAGFVFATWYYFIGT